MKKLIIIAAALALPVALTAQPIWLDQSQPRAIALEVLKPKQDNTEFLSSTLFLSVRLGISNNLVLVGELPFAYVALENVDLSKAQIGNPYLGLELARKDSPLFFELGARLPLVASRNLATVFGQLTEADRMEAFNPDITNLLAAINLQNIFAKEFFFRLRGAGSLWLSTGEGGGALLTRGEDTELFFLFSGQTGYDGKRVFLGAGVTGRLVVTEKGNFGRRTFLQLSANARLKLGRFRPGLLFRVPIEDDLQEVLDFVIGPNLSYNFK